MTANHSNVEMGSDSDQNNDQFKSWIHRTEKRSISSFQTDTDLPLYP